MVGTIQWIGALVINCTQGRDNTVGWWLWSFIVPRVGTMQWAGALVIHCAQGKDNTVDWGTGRYLCPG